MSEKDYRESAKNQNSRKRELLSGARLFHVVTAAFRFAVQKEISQCEHSASKPINRLVGSLLKRRWPSGDIIAPSHSHPINIVKNNNEEYEVAMKVSCSE